MQSKSNTLAHPGDDERKRTKKRIRGRLNCAHSKGSRNDNDNNNRGERSKDIRTNINVLLLSQYIFKEEREDLSLFIFIGRYTPATIIIVNCKYGPK
jgi:hypothetical protein